MQSWQIPWRIMKCTYVTLICIRKFQNRFPELSVVSDWKAPSSQFCISSSLLCWQRSVEIIGSSVLSSEVLVLEVLEFTARYLAFVKHFIAAFEQTFLRRLWFGDKNVNSQVLPWLSPSWLQWWAGATEKWCLKACGVFARSGPQWGVLLCWSVLAVLCYVSWQIATKTWDWMLLSAEKSEKSDL